MEGDMKKEMTANEYQKHVLRTAGRDVKGYPGWLQRMPEGQDKQEALRDWDRFVWILGLCGEAGELADLFKKHYGHGHPLDEDKVKKELGDNSWYNEALAHSFGFTSQDVKEANVAKLQKRYPNGFSSEKSLNRTE